MLDALEDKFRLSSFDLRWLFKSATQRRTLECNQSVPYADMKERFDEMIKTGKTLTSEKVKGNNALAPNITKWASSCQVVLEKAFGKKNIFLTDFQKVLKETFSFYHVDRGLPIIEAAREELDREEKSGKLEEIENEIKEGKAEAKRRATVAESKFWGSVIELIQMQRDELKRRSQVDLQISEIQKQLAELKQMVTKLTLAEKEQ